jgi:hypothetical protein
MNSILYSSRTIETKYFLLSNLKSKKKYSGFVRTQEFGCSNYYGEEVKNPIYETNIKSIISTPRNIISPIKLFDTNNKSKISNKSVSLRESCKLVLNSKNNKGLQAKFNKNYSSKRKNNLNIVKMNFPYSKPIVKNSFSELIVYKKNKDFIIAKNIEKNKKHVN